LQRASLAFNLALMEAHDQSADVSPTPTSGPPVENERHLLACEGGELSKVQVAVELVSVVAIAATTAWAIAAGHATAWHLALPMVAQWLALVLAVPFIYLVVRHPELREHAAFYLRLWAGLAVTLALVTAVRAWLDARPFPAQLELDVRHAWRWIADAHMQWPILIAVVAQLVALQGHLRNLYVHGPPFSGISLGCGMRAVVLMFGCLLLPWIIGSGTSMAWTLWWMLLIAEILTLWMLLDIQHKVRKQDQK
jgi:hypothetical protein